tara:strand:+ start:2157 stop:2957 length:801 start_codon:yes stop_codon:yes gene_type:complete
MNTPQEDRFIALKKQLQLDRAEAERKAADARKVEADRNAAADYAGKYLSIVHGDNIAQVYSDKPKLVNSLVELSLRDKNITLQEYIYTLEMKLQKSFADSNNLTKQNESQCETYKNAYNRYHDELQAAHKTITQLRSTIVDNFGIKLQLEAKNVALTTEVAALTNRVGELKARIANSDSADDAAELIQMSELYNDLLDRHQSTCAVHESEIDSRNLIDTEKNSVIRALRRDLNCIDAQLYGANSTLADIVRTAQIQLDDAPPGTCL